MKLMNKTFFYQVVVASGLLSIIWAAFLGAFGAMVYYLYTIVKSNGEYDHKTMFLFSVMGVFVAILTDFIMIDLYGQSFDGVLLLSGFLFLHILRFLDVSGFDAFLRVGLRAFGLEKKDITKLEKRDTPK